MRHRQPKHTRQDTSDPVITSSASEPVPVPAPAQELQLIKNKRATLFCYALVAIIAIFCFMVHLADPPYLFWDENYHVTSAERYIEGIAQFEPHPPLALMLIAGGEALVNPNRNIDKHILTTTKQIPGDLLPKSFSFAGMRLMPSLFAAGGALLFFGLMMELLQRRLHALLFTSLYLFENAFVVHFRAVHLDSFQMFFSLASIWQFVRLWRRDQSPHWIQYVWLAVWSGMAIMCKINAVILLPLFPLLYLKDWVLQSPAPLGRHLRDTTLKIGVSVAGMLMIFFATFYAHAAIARKLPDSGSSAGQQDLANMSPAYRQFLERHEALTPGIVVTIAIDYFKFMDKDHHGVPKLDTTKPGENGSHPLHWPLHDKTINYRWDSANGLTSYVQLTGNQVSWALGLIAALLSFQLISNHRVFGLPIQGSKRTYHLIEVFTVMYVVFMLLHLWIITQRVMYLYHYFLGLVISYILVALMWQYLSEARPAFGQRKTKILVAGVIAIFASFWFFLPLSDHWPLTHDQCELRNVFERVVECN
jgi:dolichyl-phosphate-mannose-protein mannosyltransferase